MSITKNSSPSALTTVPEDVRRKLSLPETEESWDTIQQGIIQLTEYCNGGGCVLESEIIADVRSLSRPINNALNSERSRLSGSAIELITALSTGLCRSFESLLPVFIYTLLGLCARANKLFVTRAKACIMTIIEYTKSPSILSYLAESVDSKSPSLRLAAAEGVLACLDNFNPSDRARARRFEDIIKVITQDPRADIRATGKKISAAYKAVLPEGVACAPVATVVKKTERLRSVEPSSRQGAPAGPVPRSVRNADQKRDALRPLIPVTSPPEVVENIPVRPVGGLRVRGKPQRVLISAAHPLRTDNAEKACTIRPPSVKPTPACAPPPKSYIPRYSQKNALATTKVLSVSSKLRTAILPLSKAEHPVSSRVGLLPKKVGVLSHAGVRAVTSGGQPASAKPLVEPFATMRSNLCETKIRGVRKHLLEDVKVPPIRAAPQAVSSTAVPLASFLLSTPRPSRHMQPAASLAAQPPAPANTQYAVRAPEGAIRPLRAGCRSRKSPFRSRRHNNPCTNIHPIDLLVSTPRLKIPRMEFLTSTPRDPSSLPLSPPFFLGVECIRRPPNFAGLRVARY